MSLPFALAAYRRATRLAAPLAAAWLALRAREGKEDASRRQERFGASAAARPAGRLVWLHGASVGELGVLLQLRAALAQRAPDLSFLVTTGTKTSADLFAQRPPARTHHVYVPIDTPAATERFIAHWRPDLGVLAESELWPNLILAAQARAIPLALVNATMSARTRSRWARQRNAARHLLHAFSLIIAADPRTAGALAALWGQPVPARANLKLAAPPLAVDGDALSALKAEVRARPLWLAASTHEGEDALLIEAHRIIRQRQPNALLIIAPRHTQRGAAISALAGGAPRRAAGEAIGAAPIYIADTMGEMGLLFAAAPVVFMAGSLAPELRGHNAVEPAKLSCAIVHGPYVSGHAETFALLGARGGAVEAGAPDQIAAQIERLWRDEAARARQINAARAAVDEGAAAFVQTIDAILALIPPPPRDRHARA